MSPVTREKGKSMTEATSETPALTEVLVRHAIYIYNGVFHIAIDDDVLQDVTGTRVIKVGPRDVALREAPGSPEWVARMVRARSSLVRDVEYLRQEHTRLASHLEGLGEALLEEAERRDWCGEYDEFAEQWDLPKRARDYEVTMSVRVTARDDEAAIDIVRTNVGIDQYHTEGVIYDPEFEATEV